MTGITVQRTIAAPLAEVFARATDIAGAPEVISAITKVEMLTAFAKIMAFLTRPMMKSMEKAIAQDLDELKAELEGGP